VTDLPERLNATRSHPGSCPRPMCGTRQLVDVHDELLVDIASPASSQPAACSMKFAPPRNSVLESLRSARPTLYSGARAPLSGIGTQPRAGLACRCAAAKPLRIEVADAQAAFESANSRCGGIPRPGATSCCTRRVTRGRAWHVLPKKFVQ